MQNATISQTRHSSRVEVRPYEPAGRSGAERFFLQKFSDEQIGAVRVMSAQ